MTQRRGKYNARKTTIDGYTFDSAAEARRYGALKLLEKSGDILHLKVHPKFELQAAFVDNTGSKVRAIFYEGDFEYVEEPYARMVVEDVKGVETAVFKLKSKIFRRQYPEYDFRVIPSKDVK